MSKNHSISIDFDRLNNIPYIKQFDEELFQKEVQEALDDWSQYEQHYDDIAFIRAIECTNGCVQYALRDKESFALSIEQSRKCMRLSMGFIQSKELTLPDGNHISIPNELRPQLDRIRQLYYNGFKRGDAEALRKFYANSVAMFNLLGSDRLTTAQLLVKEHYEDVFTNNFLFMGVNYMKQFLTVMNDEQEKEERERDFLKLYHNEDHLQ